MNSTEIEAVTTGAAVAIRTALQTYTAMTGHGAPRVPATVKINDQGITLNLGLHDRHDFGTEGDRTPEVHVERRRDEWAISISPDSDDARLIVTVRDDGTIGVKGEDADVARAQSSAHALLRR